MQWYNYVRVSRVPGTRVKRELRYTRDRDSEYTLETGGGRSDLRDKVDQNSKTHRPAGPGPRERRAKIKIYDRFPHDQGRNQPQTIDFLWAMTVWIPHPPDPPGRGDKNNKRTSTNTAGL
jgi:hypothetical protein